VHLPITKFAMLLLKASQVFTASPMNYRSRWMALLAQHKRKEVSVKENWYFQALGGWLLLTLPTCAA
jgi:hypothetical protein